VNNTSPRKSTADPYKEISKIKSQIEKLEHEKKKNYEILSDTYLALANELANAEEWLKGEEAASTVIKLAKKLKDKILKNLKIAQANEVMGRIYGIIQEYQKAIKYFNEGLNALDTNFEELLKDRNKMTEDEFAQQIVLTKSLYIDFLKQKISLLLQNKEDKQAKESIIKPIQKYLKTRDPNCIEILLFLSDIKIELALQLNDSDEVIRAVSELLLLDFFAKKFSEAARYWSNKFHRDIKEKSKFLVKTLKIPLNKKVLGNETLQILKQVNLEIKDHMYIDKILDFKQLDSLAENINDLTELLHKIKEDDASPIVLSLARNELMLALAEVNKYNEAFESAKDTIKELKKIKNKSVRDFLLGETQRNLFKINVKRQDYKQAEKEIRKSIEYFEENLNTLGHACVATLELANCYILQDRFDKAKALLTKPIESCERFESAELLARLYEVIANVELKLKNFNAAAICFVASALFYLMCDDQEKYKEFFTLSVNLYNQYLELIQFPTITL